MFIWYGIEGFGFVFRRVVIWSGIVRVVWYKFVMVKLVIKRFDIEWRFWLIVMVVNMSKFLLKVKIDIMIK